MSQTIEYLEYNHQYRNYKIKLYPNKFQREKMLNTFDVYRYCYNWGVAYWDKYYAEHHRSPRKFDMLRDFGEYRNATPWLREYELTTCRFALLTLCYNYKMFFNGSFRHPKFKSKRRSRQIFQLRGERLKFYNDGAYIQIPGITDKDNRMYCKGKHHIPIHPDAKYQQAYITYDGNSFWLSVSVCMKTPFIMEESLRPIDEPLGIDVGVRTAAFLSNGKSYDAPNRHRVKVLQNRIEALQSAIERDRDRRCKESMRTRTKYVDIPKSKNEIKRESKYRKANRDLVNLYRGLYHQISADIVKQNPEFVVLETLEITRMKQENKHTKRKQVSRSIYEARLGTLMTYIKYKCADHEIPVISAPRDFPSTKLCSRCGHKHPNIGSSKIYRCPECGAVIDRDYNAALNLRDYGCLMYYGY